MKQHWAPICTATVPRKTLKYYIFYSTKNQLGTQQTRPLYHSGLVFETLLKLLHQKSSNKPQTGPLCILFTLIFAGHCRHQSSGHSRSRPPSFGSSRSKDRISRPDRRGSSSNHADPRTKNEHQSGRQLWWTGQVRAQHWHKFKISEQKVYRHYSKTELRKPNTITKPNF